EVPADVLGGDALVRAGQPSVERMGTLSVDLDLREHREVDTEVDRAELGDLGLAAGLLMHELVAGETHHHQALIAELLVQLLQALVLRRESALAGGVDHQHHRTEVIGEIDTVAVDRRGLEVRKSCHAPIVEPRAACARHRGSAVLAPVALWFGGPVAVPSCAPWLVPLPGPVLGGARARAHGAGRTLRTRAARPRPACPSARTPRSPRRRCWPHGGPCSLRRRTATARCRTSATTVPRRRRTRTGSARRCDRPRRPTGSCAGGSRAPVPTCGSGTRPPPPGRGDARSGSATPCRA